MASNVLKKRRGRRVEQRRRPFPFKNIHRFLTFVILDFVIFCPPKSFGSQFPGTSMGTDHVCQCFVYNSFLREASLTLIPDDGVSQGFDHRGQFYDTVRYVVVIFTDTSVTLWAPHQTVHTRFGHIQKTVVVFHVHLTLTLALFNHNNVAGSKKENSGQARHAECNGKNCGCPGDSTTTHG